MRLTRTLPNSFARWTSEAALLEAWRRVRRNKGGAGGDGLSLNEFVRDLDCRLLKLSDSLRNGEYRPGPLRQAIIPKSGGGRRVLAIPCVADRIAQASLATYLAARFDHQMSPASYAYRPGRSVAQAAGALITHAVEGYTWVVDGDIRSFFDRVPHGRMQQDLRCLGIDRRTYAVIALWLQDFGVGNRGLAQGSPLSPILANLFLTPIDRAIAVKRVRLIHYADDFLLLTRSRREAAKAADRMASLLASRGLALHPEKTKICNLSVGLDFLGLHFVGTDQQGFRMIGQADLQTSDFY